MTEAVNRLRRYAANLRKVNKRDAPSVDFGLDVLDDIIRDFEWEQRDMVRKKDAPEIVAEAKEEPYRRE
ncbi:hypothetical protein LCGC14_2788070 [marine sediment metagenome]|uniref:Uncharacterized protein n=1 Tax=marine sediment metagenome TaxID=412755 RepID=A0A0F9ART1_9ZZZZ